MMKKRFADPDRDGYFVGKDGLRKFTIRSGIRYVYPLPIVVEPNGAATGCCQAQSFRGNVGASSAYEH